MHHLSTEFGGYDGRMPSEGSSRVSSEVDLLVELVNTRVLDGPDRLADLPGTRAWVRSISGDSRPGADGADPKIPVIMKDGRAFRSHHDPEIMIAGDVDEGQRVLLVQLREALREAWVEHGSGEAEAEAEPEPEPEADVESGADVGPVVLPPDLVDLLERASVVAGLRPMFTVDGAGLSAATGPQWILGLVAGAVFWTLASGDWSRLKACQNDTCHEAFYDTTRKASRTWCSMTPCGNRIKARAFRRRHRTREAR
jgi:hypothetical protein